MKNFIIIVSIMILSNTMVFSQWLEKEGYWELEQNYGQLRDIKLNESTNELWIVTADNKVIAIDAQTGIEIKRCECELDRAAEGGKISSDFLTIGFISAYIRVQSTEKLFDTLYFDYFNISDCSKMFNHKVGLNHLVSQGGINGIEFSFYDFIFESQHLIISYKINNMYYNGPNDINNEYGFTKQFTLINNKLNLVDSIDKSFSNVQYYENRTSFFSTSTMSYSQSWSNWGGGWNFSVHNLIYEYDIMNKTTSTLFNHIYGGNSDGDKRGHDIRISKILANGNNKFITLSQKTLYDFSKNDTWFNDSLMFVYDVNDFLVTQNNEYVLVSTNKSVEAYNYKQKKLLESNELPSPASSLILDSKKKNLLLYCADNKIRYITPDILKPIPDLGFIFDKQLVHTGEKIQFNAICNIDTCEYEWEFLPGITTKTNNKDIEYTYNSPGIYDVKLTIITPDGERHDFLKEKIIKVIDKPKADFSFELLNNELPLIVKFTNLSKGELIERFWDFGDGTTSAEPNPIHDYKYSGDFTVRLMVRDSLGADTLTKYEAIINRISTPINESHILQKRFSNRYSEIKKVYSTSSGFIINSFNYSITQARNPNGKNYTLHLFFDEIDKNFDIIRSASLTCGQFEYPFMPKPISNEMQMNDSIFYIAYNGESNGYKVVWNLRTNSNVYELKSNYSKLFDKSIFIKNVNIDTLFWVADNYWNSSLFISNYNFEPSKEFQLGFSSNTQISIEIFADVINNEIYLIIKKIDGSYRYFTFSTELNLKKEIQIIIPNGVTLSGIKSVNDNLILLYGSYKDTVNKTTYAYFGKYYPQSNILQDTILYSRKDIRKIERVNNSTYAAIGQSRGRQGYLLLDTNLHQIKDIRVENLIGEIKDMILYDNKVYLFTEKVVSNQTMALGANESYQTTASVLSLPDDIISNVEDSPKIFVDKFTHSAYPNPASDVINLKVSSVSNDKCSIKLYDLLGVEIQTIYDGIMPAGTERNFSITSSGLNPGAYYYVIRNGSGFGSGQINVIR